MGDVLKGRYASIKLGSTLVENLGKWTLNVKMDEIDVSVFGTVWGKSVPGMQKWSGTIEGFYDPADSTGQIVLQDAALAATKITDLKLFVDNTDYWAPAQDEDSDNGAYITSVDINHDKAGVAAVTMNIVGFGQIKLYQP